MKYVCSAYFLCNLFVTPSVFMLARTVSFKSSIAKLNQIIQESLPMYLH